MSSSVLPVFSSKSFIVSGLTFRSLIHYEFIFVYGFRKCSNFILLHVAVQFPQHHLLKRLSLPYCIFLPPLSKTRNSQVHGFISELSILFHQYVFLVLCQYHTVLMTVGSQNILSLKTVNKLHFFVSCPVIKKEEKGLDLQNNPPTNVKNILPLALERTSGRLFNIYANDQHLFVSVDQNTDKRLTLLFPTSQ